MERCEELLPPPSHSSKLDVSCRGSARAKTRTRLGTGLARDAKPAGDQRDGDAAEGQVGPTHPRAQRAARRVVADDAEEGGVQTGEALGQLAPPAPFFRERLCGK